MVTPTRTQRFGSILDSDQSMRMNMIWTLMIDLLHSDQECMAKQPLKLKKKKKDIKKTRMQRINIINLWSHVWLNHYPTLQRISWWLLREIKLLQATPKKCSNLKNYTSIESSISSLLNLVMSTLTMVQVESAGLELQALPMECFQTRTSKTTDQKEEEMSIWQIKVIQIATILNSSLRLTNANFFIQEKKVSATKGLVKLRMKNLLRSFKKWRI